MEFECTWWCFHKVFKKDYAQIAEEMLLLPSVLIFLPIMNARDGGKFKKIQIGGLLINLELQVHNHSVFHLNEIVSRVRVIFIYLSTLLNIHVIRNAPSLQSTANSPRIFLKHANLKTFVINIRWNS